MNSRFGQLRQQLQPLLVFFLTEISIIIRRQACRVWQDIQALNNIYQQDIVLINNRYIIHNQIYNHYTKSIKIQKLHKIKENMDSLYQQINQHRQHLKQIRAYNNQNYFDTSELLEQIYYSQARINNMIEKLEEERKQSQLRNYVLKNKINPHPNRNTVQLEIDVFEENLKKVQSRNQKFINQFLQVNSRLQLKINPKRIYPVYKCSDTKRSPTHLIPNGLLKFLLFHIDKKSETGCFKFNPTLNIHKPNFYSTKLQKLQIAHDFTMSNYSVMKQLLKQSKIYIFLENQNKLITSVCELSLFDLYQITHKVQKSEQTIKLQSQVKLFQNHNDQRKLLKFCMIGTKQEIFTLQCQIIFQKLLISPQMFQLKQKAHYQRVVVHSPNRSRSPSPTLHRLKAKSLIKTNDKTQALVILSNRTACIKINGLIQNSGAESPKKFTILKIQNIEQSYQIQIIQKKDQKFLKMLIKTKNQQKNGYIQIKISNIIYEVYIKNLKIFQFFSLENSKTLFKAEEDCQKIHGVIILTKNVYIRPNMNCKIIESLYKQKIVSHSYGNYFLKGQAANNYSLYPAQIRDVLTGQKGVSINYNVESEWFRNKTQPKLVITAIKKQFKKPNTEKVMKNYEISQIYNDSQIQIHILNYTIIQMPVPQLTLTLDVKGPGIYAIQSSSLLAKNTKYRCYSLNQTILQVCKHRFQTQIQPAEIIQVQLFKQIQIKENVLIVLQNISKRIVNFIKLIVMRVNYWER